MTIIDRNIQDIKRLCANHKVRRLYAFGSVLTNDFTEDSDVDLLVVFNSLDLNQYADNYYELKTGLQNIFRRHVDLLEDTAITNPFLRRNLDQQRKLVYAD